MYLTPVPDGVKFVGADFSPVLSGKSPVYDKNGIELRDGDIVAESEVGKVIWDGHCRIIEVPLGKVKIYEDGKVNVFSYKPGRVEELIPYDYDKMREYVRNDGRLYFSTWDGVCTAWDDITVVKNEN